jgi:hypothetical protein
VTTVLILYEGDDITPDVVYSQARFTGRAGGQPGEAILRVKDADHAYVPGYFHGGGTLELYLDGVREWDGWVVGTSQIWAFPADDTRDVAQTPRFWVLRGADRNLLFTRRFIYDLADPANPLGLPTYPAATTDKEAIDDYLANYVDLTGDDIDVVSGIEEVSTPDPYAEFKIATVGGHFGLLFEDIVKMTGALFYIDPDRVLRYNDDVTVTAPFFLSDAPGDLGVGFRDGTIRPSADAMCNDYLIWGAGRGSPDPVFGRVEDADSIALHGRFQVGEVYEGAWKLESVTHRAETYVYGSPDHRRGHKDDQVFVECTIFEPGLRVGQVVEFESQQWDYVDFIPVREMTMSFPTPTDVRYDLKLGHEIDTALAPRDPWFEDDWPSGDSPIPEGGSEVIDEFDREVPRPGGEFVFVGTFPSGNVSNYNFATSVDYQSEWDVATSGYVWLGRDRVLPTPATLRPFAEQGIYRDTGIMASTSGSTRPVYTTLVDYPFEDGIETLWRWRAVGELWYVDSYTAYGDDAEGEWALGMTEPRFMPFGQTAKKPWTIRTQQFFPDYWFFLGGGPSPPGSAGTWITRYVLDEAWQLTRVRISGGRFQARTWYDGAAEPATWDVDLARELPVDDSASSYVGGPEEVTVGWFGPRPGTVTGEPPDQGVVSSKPRTAELQIDYIRRVVSGPALPDVYWLPGTGTYQTAYPYVPGTLEVTLDGQVLRLNIDFNETAPLEGKFTINSTVDETDGLVVRYQKHGDSPTDPPQDSLGGPPVEGYSGGQVYRPRPISQFGWGTALDGNNCVFASSAMCLMRHTLGALSPTSGSPTNTPPHHRTYSGDTSGGATTGAAKHAWNVGWNQNMLDTGWVSWQVFVNAINAGRGAIVLGHYPAMPSPYNFSPSYDAGHAIYINEQFSDGSFWGVDPIRQRALRYPEHVLRHYVEAFTDGHHVDAAFSQETPLG